LSDEIPSRQTNNIKKLVKELEAYYRDALQLDCPRASAIEPAAVASGDGAAIAQLLELVLGCAVQCDGKERCEPVIPVIPHASPSSSAISTPAVS
jgi:hypothetical protein